MLVGVGLAFRARGEAGDRAWVICLRGRAEGDARDVYGEGRMLGPAWACFTAFTYVRATGSSAPWEEPPGWAPTVEGTVCV